MHAQNDSIYSMEVLFPSVSPKSKLLTLPWKIRLPRQIVRCCSSKRMSWVGNRSHYYYHYLLSLLHHCLRRHTDIRHHLLAYTIVALDPLSFRLGQGVLLPNLDDPIHVIITKNSVISNESVICDNWMRKGKR